jgi:hypothetical protein
MADVYLFSSYTCLAYHAEKQNRCNTVAVPVSAKLQTHCLQELQSQVVVPVYRGLDADHGDVRGVR